VLRATNLDAGAELEVPLLKVIRPGTVQLPTGSVIKAIADAKTASVEIEELPSETLLFMADPKVPGRKVAVRTPQAFVTLPTYDPEHFPAITPADLTQAVEIQAWRFRRLLARTLFAADENSPRYALGGCAFEFRDGSLHCIATDGRCLAHAFEDATGTGLIAPPTTVVGGEERPLAPVVPSRALKALAAILDAKEYPALTLGLTAPEGKCQVQARGLLFVSRLLEGRFPAWKEVFPQPSKAALRVMNPGRLLQLLKETTRYTTRQSPATELRLRRHVLTIVVENDHARTSRELIVRNLSEAPDQEASVVVDPRYLLAYLAAQTQPFVLSFPPEKGTPLLCQSEGFRFVLMPLEQAEKSETGVPELADRPETAVTQQGQNREVPLRNEALSA
jgi:DNA polymerase-3 subunit beta